MTLYDAHIQYDAHVTYDGIVTVPSGTLRIGRFVDADPSYTIDNEILSHDQLDEGQARPNVAAVDGQDDSWTEYGRGDLNSRDVAINAYLDLPELQSVGDVRQRALQELETASRTTSPGGACSWMPWFSRMDKVFWIAEDASKYEARIEGLTVEVDQTTTPSQRATIDTGLLVFCPPDTVDTYIARDLFERVTSSGLGDADTGGTWTTS